jgi:hypothetical protein
MDLSRDDNVDRIRYVLDLRPNAPGWLGNAMEWCVAKWVSEELRRTPDFKLAQLLGDVAPPDDDPDFAGRSPLVWVRVQARTWKKFGPEVPEGIEGAVRTAVGYYERHGEFWDGPEDEAPPGFPLGRGKSHYRPLNWS